MNQKQLEARNNIKKWRENPARFVNEQFHVEPDKWQNNALNAFASMDRDKMRVSLQACAGVGKTATLAWCGWLFLACYGDHGEHPKGAAVSITADNLKDNLWSEFSRWHSRSEYLKHNFVWTKERIFAKDFSETWFLSARSWSKTANAEEQGRTLSGLHSKYVVVMLDESGEIPPSVLKAGEQALGNCIFGKMIQAGNPTSHNGVLYLAANELRHLWHIIRITGDPDDTERSSRVDIEWAREQIKIYGRNDPWVMAYILGQFPPSSINSLLGIEEVETAMRRRVESTDYEHSQKRLGIDVARFGLDTTCIFPRQGLMAFKPVIMRDARSNEIAARVALAKSRWNSELEFVDSTGGWGSGVVDSLIQAGHAPIEVNFSGKAVDNRYHNKRSEIHFLLAEWVKRGGCLPNDPELVKELTAPTYTFQNGKFAIEPKEQIKKRLGYSPDCFVKDTMVKTSMGNIPIQHIKVGDTVSTPLGDRIVIKTWESKVLNTNKVTFSNGHILEGKGKHTIFTWNNGWIRLDSLTLTNDIEIDSIARRIKWKFLNILFTSNRNTGFKQAVDITLGEQKKRLDFYIELYGKSTIAEYLMGILYIIKTITGKITGLKILSLSKIENINRSICELECKMKHTVKRLLKTLMPQDYLHLAGMEAMKELDGTQNMVRKHGMEERNIKQNAQYATKSTQLTLHQDQTTVLSHAHKRTTIKAIKQMSASALNAALNLIRINIRYKVTAQDNVQIVHDKEVTVYNLTLDKDNIYYANGILVSNCADALALTFALPDMPASHSIEGMKIERGKLLHEYDPFDGL